MQIYGLNQIHQAHSLKPTQRFEEVKEAAVERSSQYGPDELAISAEAQQALEASESTPVRADTIASIRAQSANGTYETPEKLELALSRMFDVLG